MDDNALIEVLKTAGFDPPDNVCARCKHPGGDHDLGNWCLVCPRPYTGTSTNFSLRSAAGWDYFSSMNDAEQWAYGLEALRAKGYDIVKVSGT